MCDEPHPIQIPEDLARHGFFLPLPPVNEDMDLPERAESFEFGRRPDEDTESSSLAVSIEIVGEGDGDGDGAAGGARVSSGRLRARGGGGAASH